MGQPLHFLPFSRRGLAAGTAAAGPDGRLHVRQTLTVTTEASGTGAVPAPVPVLSAPLAVFGPGDVVGVDASQIVRRHPVHGDANLEPNYLAGIEFAHPDLPWMFSPEPDNEVRAQPWLMLVVLPASTGGVPAVGRQPGSPCPVITLGQADDVPDPGNAWAFAHVQVFGAEDADTARDWVASLAGFETTVRSRLLCPTRLEPGRSYVAALVPTYELGRLAGLGLTPGAAPVGTRTWTPAAGLALPVYDSWTFHTAAAGDFETLARKLRRAPADVMEKLGARTVAVEPRSAALPAVDALGAAVQGGVFAVPTAIARVAHLAGPGELAPDLLPAAERPAALHNVLKSLLDQVGQADDADPLVGPPLYGQWPAKVRTVDGEDHVAEVALADVDGAPGSRQGWIEQLNADPAQRIAAGLGARTVQIDQEPLMKEAWLQLEDVEAANHRLRWSALFATMSTVLHVKIAGQNDQAALRFLAPAAGRLRDLQTPAQTFKATLDASVVAPVVLSPAFVRTARFAVRDAQRAPHAEGVQFSTTTLVGSLVRAMEAGAAELRPPRFGGVHSVDPGILRELVNDAGFGPRISESLGESAAGYLERASQIPALLGSLASKVVVQAPEIPAHGEVPHHPVRRHHAPGLDVHGGLLEQDGLHPFEAAHTPHSPFDVHELGHEVHVDAGHVDTGLFVPAEQENIPVAGLELVRISDFTPDQMGLVFNPDIVTEKLDLGAGFALEAVTLARTLDITESRSSQAAAMLGIQTAAQDSLGVARLDLGAVFTEDPQSSALLTAALGGVGNDLADVDARVALPVLKALDPDTAAGMLAAVEPMASYTRMLAYAATFDPTLVRRRAGDAFSPAMAAPVFPTPAVERLKRLDEGWILGGVGLLPENSVSVLQVNWKFVESFLAGSNHEMARELLWRRYPTDLRGSCFRQFWAGAGEDIASMDRWAGPLGTHAAAQQGGAPAGRGELMVLVLKGDLLRRYPNTVISAVRGFPTPHKPGDAFTTTESRRELFHGFLSRDVSYIGLDLSPADLAFNDPADARHSWYIQLLEPHNEPRFGLDEQPSDAPGSNKENPLGGYENSDAWSWQGLPGPAPAPGTRLHLVPGQAMAADSAALAANLFQRPFRLLLRATDYI
ncbi:hypothetical protein [Arthrobacter sp. 35W]|uniref:hypothetical protein n=1 Tax=Arthrobacter sp. 35W TaxID=1132441 RepID=UPI0004054562|nr:hypothetical protein [Arthrobacter sp. 35W]